MTRISLPYKDRRRGVRRVVVGRGCLVGECRKIDGGYEYRDADTGERATFRTLKRLKAHVLETSPHARTVGFGVEVRTGGVWRRDALLDRNGVPRLHDAKWKAGKVARVESGKGRRARVYRITRADRRREGAT